MYIEIDIIVTSDVSVAMIVLVRSAGRRVARLLLLLLPASSDASATVLAGSWHCDVLVLFVWWFVNVEHFYFYFYFGVLFPSARSQSTCVNPVNCACGCYILQERTAFCYFTIDISLGILSEISIFCILILLINTMACTHLLLY